MTTMCPMPAAVAPLPTTSRSTTTTRNPRCANTSAQAAPTIPAPTITTSYDSLLMLASNADPHAEGIPGIQNQVCFCIYESCPCNAGEDFAIFHPHSAFENAAHNAFLPPDLAFFNLSVG